MNAREWLTRLFDWTRRDRLDAELTDELRFHREQLERDHRATGADEREAKRQAAVQLGNVTRVREEARERWSWPWLDHLQLDLRLALRGLRRSPGFAATVIVTLGLGIGANAAMFGVVDRLMFRPYPYLRDHDQVSRVYLQTTFNGRTNTYVSFPYARYLDLARWTTSLEQAAPFVSARHGVGIGDRAREQAIVGAGAEYFAFFDAPPALGRYFSRTEDSLGAVSNVAVLGHSFWRSEFGGRDVLGQELLVGRTRYVIIGVVPAGFIGIAQSREPAVYVPITAYAANEGGGSRNDYWERYNWDWTEMIVRRKPGVSLEEANADLTRAFLQSRVRARTVHPNYAPVERASPAAIAGPLRTAAGPDAGLESRTLLWVTGVAAVVLLIACANVANLYLARAIRRRREAAVRLALGVSRGRLLSQAVCESLLLALIGCGLGVLLAQAGGASLHRLVLPFENSFNLVTDYRTLAAAIGAALIAAVLSGVLPVMLAGQRDVFGALKAGARDGGAQRSALRSSLLVAQGSLSVVLLIGAGLFVRSLWNVMRERTGYDPGPVLMMHWERRGTAQDMAERQAVQRRALEAALATPGVAAAAWVSNVPMQGTSTASLAVPGIDSVAALGRFNFQASTPGYFEVLGINIIHGRSYTETDVEGGPLVAVVSEGMARVLWPDRDPLGQCLRVSWRGEPVLSQPCTTVIGVAEDVLQDPVNDQPLRYYLPELQVRLGVTQLVVQVRGDPAAQAETVRRSVQRALPEMSFLFVQQMRDLFQRQRRAWRLGAMMFVAFGVLAVVVAAVGLYGVISYNVVQRSHELGVRVALGAQPRDLVRLVTGDGVRFALAGIVIGSALALGAGRWVQPLLFHQSAKDPVIFVFVAVTLLLVSLASSALPAFRATRADPNTALRSE